MSFSLSPKEAKASCVPLLSREGFQEWLMQMNALLRVKGLYNVVNAREFCPDKPVRQTKKAMKEYDKQKLKFANKIHRAWYLLVMACGHHWQSLIKPFEKRMQVNYAWNAILEEFGHGSSQLSTHQTEKHFAKLAMKRTGADLQMDFKNFAAEVDSVADRLAVLTGVPVPDSRKIFVLTEGLPVEFTDFTNNLLAIKDSMTFAEAVESISTSIKRNKVVFEPSSEVASSCGKSKKVELQLGEDSGQTQQPSAVDTVANLAMYVSKLQKQVKWLKRAGRIGGNRENGCGDSDGHSRKRSRSQIRCHTCRGYGHTKMECPSFRDDDDDQRQRSKQRRDDYGERVHAALSGEDLDLMVHNKVVRDDFANGGGSLTDDELWSRKHAIFEGMLENMKQAKKGNKK